MLTVHADALNVMSFDGGEVLIIAVA